jgi:NitT/TauT family transport system ATP-binding protein/nitrate/nitrite transport system substrate-binding protein
MHAMMPEENSAGGLPVLHAGFIPLCDCAPLVIARERGFDAEFGFSLRLHREVSWANIRDKTEYGIFDCAHMLAPMPIASTLGIGRPAVAMIAPMALNLNGNAITVSVDLFAQMRRADPANASAGGMAAAHALAAVIRERRQAGHAPLTLGMVHPFSCHNYDLRYWLAAAGVDPDNDVRLVVIPPPLIAESLKEGQVDGFCVGAPWGSVAVEMGYGRIVATKLELWANSPEKVLGVRRDWADENMPLLLAAIKALLKAAAWLDDEANRDEAAEILSRPHYIGVAAPVLRRIMSGTLIRERGAQADNAPDFLVFHRYAANFPWVSHGVWLMTQMARWGQIGALPDMGAVAAGIFRPDIYREAASALGLNTPLADLKSEGADAATGEIAGDKGPIALGARRFFADETFRPEEASAT